MKVSEEQVREPVRNVPWVVMLPGFCYDLLGNFATSLGKVRNLAFAESAHGTD